MEVKSRAQELGRHTPTGTQHLSLAAKPPTTFPALIENLVSAYGDRVFLPRRRARMVEPISFSRLTRDLERVSAGLLSLGIGHGDRVGLLADNRYDWLLADLATVCIGAVDVPRGADTATAEMLFILAHAGCRASFVEDDRTAERRLQVQERLTTQIADCIQRILAPQGVAVVIEALHLCMTMRGVEKQSSFTTTSSMLGCFKEDVRTRSEFLDLLKLQGTRR